MKSIEMDEAAPQVELEETAAPTESGDPPSPSNKPRWQAILSYIFALLPLALAAVLFLRAIPLTSTSITTNVLFWYVMATTTGILYGTLPG